MSEKLWLKICPSVYVGVAVTTPSLLEAFRQDHVYWSPAMEAFRETNAQRRQHEGQAWLPEEILTEIQGYVQAEGDRLGEAWRFENEFRDSRNLTIGEVERLIDGPIARKLEQSYGMTSRVGAGNSIFYPGTLFTWICIPWKPTAPTPPFEQQSHIVDMSYAGLLLKIPEWRHNSYKSSSACIVEQKFDVTLDVTLPINKVIKELNLKVVAPGDLLVKGTYLCATISDAETRTEWPYQISTKHGKIWIPKAIYVHKFVLIAKPPKIHD